MADGELRFDTSIDESGVNDGLKRINRGTKKAAKGTADDAKDAAKSTQEAARETAKETEKAAKQTKEGAKKAGKDVEESARKASETVRRTSGESGREVDRTTRETTRNTQEAMDSLAQVLAASGVKDAVMDIANTLLECAEASASFETAVAKVGTIADASQKPLGEMREEILKLSSDTGKSVGELSEATYQAISASVATGDAVEFVGKSNKLAVGGFSDTTTAVDILTTAINAYGMSAEDASKISDILITTQNLGKTSVADLGKNMGKVIPLASAYNMKLEDLSTGYAILTANGIKTEEATTYIKAALNELGSSTSNVGKILKEQTGKSFSQLTKGGNNLGDVLDILSDSVDGDVTAFSNLWSSSEAGIGMLAILNSGTEKYNSVLKQMEGSAGATDTAFEKMSDTTEHVQERFSNAADNLKIAIGDVLTPAINEMKTAGTEALQWAAEFVEENPWVVAAVTALTAALGVLTAALLGFSVIGMITPLIQAFNAALAANPIMMVVVALTALTAAAVSFGTVMKDRTSETAENQKAVKKCRKSYEELQKAVEESTARSEENKASLESEYGACKVLSDKLYDLADKTHKTASDKAQMAAMVDELNSKIPGLNLSIDETTGALNRQRSETDNLIESMKNQALASAAQEDMAEAAKNLYEAEKQRNEALEVYKDLRKQAKAAEEEYQRALAGSGTTASEAYNIYETKMSSLNKQMKEQEEILKEQREGYREIRGQFQSASDAAAGYIEAAGGVAEANRQNAQSGEDAAGSAGVQEDALESLKQKYSEFHKQLEQDIQNKVSLFDTFDGGEDMSVETMLENIRKQKEGLENWKANMETLAGEVGTTITPEFYNAILEMGPQAANAVQHMAATLDQSNGKELLAQLAQDWGYNLDFSGPASESLSNTGKMVESGLMGVLNVARSAGVSIPEDLASGITSGTMDLSTAADGLGNELSKGMGQLTQMAKEAGVQVPAEITAGLEQGGQAAVDAAQSLINLIAGQSGEMAETGNENGEALNQGTEEGLKSSSGEVIDTASDVGDEVGTAMQESEASGIEQNAGKVNSAVDSTMQGAVNTANGYKSSFDDVGYSMAEGVAAGINKGSPIINSAVNSVLQSAVNEGEKKIKKNSPSHVWRDEIGLSMAEGLAVGLDRGTKQVEESTRNMADASLVAAKDELEIHSPSDVFKKEVGKQIVAGIAKGVKKEQAKLNETMKQLSGDAVAASKGALGKYSDVGSEIMDSITEGMQKRQDRLSGRLEKLIDKKVEKVSNGKKVSSFEKLAEKYGRKKSKKSQKKAEKYAKKAKQYREAFAEIGEELTNAMNQGISEEFDKIRSETEEVLSEISDRYQALYDEIKSKQEDMFGKMANPANLYDLDTQLIQIDRYQKGLEKLKNRLPGNETGESLMEQVLGMDVSEADNFMDYLNSLTDTQLADYLGKWEKIQGQAKGYSESFFKQDFEDAQKAYEGEIAKAMADAEAKMKNVGRNIGEGILAGLKESMDDMPKEVRKMAKKLVKSFRKAFDINSPSRVMKKEVGRYLPPGISEGFLQALPKAERQISDGVLRAIDDLQGRVLGLQCMPAAPFLSMPAQPSVTVKNSQPVQVQAEIHTTVDVDGRTLGKVVTPYVNQNLGDIQKREERGS